MPISILLTSTLFGAPVYRTYGALIADRKFSPAGFAAPLGLKDIRLALAAAEDLRVPLPLASLLRDRFLTLLAHGGEALDWSAIGQLAARDAGENAPPRVGSRLGTLSKTITIPCGMLQCSRGGWKSRDRKLPYHPAAPDTVRRDLHANGLPWASLNLR
ncbi:MAG: NAD-binding protein [Rhodospirillales bacterium]